MTQAELWVLIEAGLWGQAGIICGLLVAWAFLNQ